MIKEIKGFAYLTEMSQDENNPVFTENESMERYGWVKLGKAILSYEVQDKFSVNAARVEMLKYGLEKLSDDFYTKKSNIEQQIQNLLCIENDA